jgi:hypothetical protein
MADLRKTLPIYAPNVAEITAPGNSKADYINLTRDKADPKINLDTNNVRTNPAVPVYTLGNPREGGQQMTHHQFVIHNDAANPAVNLDTNNVRTNPKIADYMLGDPRTGGQQMTHHQFVLSEDKAGKTAAINVNSRKVRGGFFSPALSNDLSPAFNSTKYIAGIYAPEIPPAGERATVFDPGTSPVKKRK